MNKFKKGQWVRVLNFHPQDTKFVVLTDAIYSSAPRDPRYVVQDTREGGDMYLHAESMLEPYGPKAGETWHRQDQRSYRVHVKHVDDTHVWGVVSPGVGEWPDGWTRSAFLDYYRPEES